MKLAAEGLAAGWRDDRGGGVRGLGEGWGGCAEPDYRQRVHGDNYKMLQGCLSVCLSVGGGLHILMALFSTGGAVLYLCVCVCCPFFLCLLCFRYIVKAIKIEIVLGAVSEMGGGGGALNPHDRLFNNGWDRACVCVCVSVSASYIFFCPTQAAVLV